MRDSGISVIIPCYNGASYLQETLQSALNQTHHPLEVIMVDDGSTDDSVAIAKAFEPRVTVLRQKNQGVSTARNQGIKEAKGDYLLFLDADDLLKLDALEQLFNAVHDKDRAVGLMGCAWFEHDPTVPLRVLIPHATAFFPDIIKTNLGVPHRWLVPKTLALEVGGFTVQMSLSADWDFYARIGLTGAQLVPLAYVGAYYRQHASSMSKVTNTIERKREHAVVMQHLSDGILQNAELIDAHGKTMFWSAWTAFHNAVTYGVAWQELQPLARNIEALAKHGPDAIRKTPFAHIIRVCGARWADTIRHLFVR